MMAVPVKWKAMTLQEKLDIVQKLGANPNSTCSDGCSTYEIGDLVTGWAQKYIKQMIVGLYFKKE